VPVPVVCITNMTKRELEFVELRNLWLLAWVSAWMVSFLCCESLVLSWTRSIHEVCSQMIINRVRKKKTYPGPGGDTVTLLSDYLSPLWSLFQHKSLWCAWILLILRRCESLALSQTSSHSEQAVYLLTDYKKIYRRHTWVGPEVITSQSESCCLSPPSLWSPIPVTAVPSCSVVTNPWCCNGLIPDLYMQLIRK
jgi:hypothetical protein